MKREKYLAERGISQLATSAQKCNLIPTMTTVLSEKGDISLPEPLREELHLVPGEDFEIFVEDNDTITLHRVSQPANHGLVDLLLSSPAQFEVPPRENDDSEPLAL